MTPEVDVVQQSRAITFCMGLWLKRFKLRNIFKLLDCIAMLFGVTKLTAMSPTLAFAVQFRVSTS